MPRILLVHLKITEKSKFIFYKTFSLKQLKDAQLTLTKMRETNGLKDAGMEALRQSTTGETKIVVQRWSNNVA
jgi:hypothetical protein